MATQALAVVGSQLRVGNGVSPGGVALSAATNTSPIVITSTPHGITDISHGTITGVAGNLGANGSFVVEAVTPTTLKLRNSVGTGAYTGGGILTLDSTYTPVAEIRTVTDAGFLVDLVDVSSWDSVNGWGSSLPILKRGKAMRVEVNLVPNHPTHNPTTGFIALAQGRISRPWMLVFPDTQKSATWMQAWVSDEAADAVVTAQLRATFVLALDGVMQWSTA
jgi:hypothetical protein